MKSGTWSWVDKFTVHKKLVVNKFYMPPFGSQCTHFWEKFLASVGNFHWILLFYGELWFFLQFGASHLHFLMILVTNKFSNDVFRFTITSCLQPVQIVEFYFRGVNFKLSCNGIFKDFSSSLFSGIPPNIRLYFIPYVFISRSCSLVHCFPILVNPPHFQFFRLLFPLYYNGIILLWFFQTAAWDHV